MLCRVSWLSNTCNLKQAVLSSWKPRSCSCYIMSYALQPDAPCLPTVSRTSDLIICKDRVQVGNGNVGFRRQGGSPKSCDTLYGDL